MKLQIVPARTGALWVRDDAGTCRRVLSGDVSVRGVMGYV